MAADIRYVQIRLSSEQKAQVDAVARKANCTLQDFIEKLINESLRTRQSKDQRALKLDDLSPAECDDLLDYLELLRDPDPESSLQNSIPAMVREVMAIRRRERGQ